MALGYDNDPMAVVRSMYSLMVDEFINQEHMDIRAFTICTKPLRDRTLNVEALRQLGYDSREVIQEYLSEI